MNVFKLFDPKLLAVIAFGGIVSVAAAGFAAANTVSNSIAGDGSGTIGSVTVSNVHYQLNSDPTKIDKITFTLSSVPTNPNAVVKATVDGGTTWINCSVTANSVCPDTGTLSGVNTISPTALRVVVAD